MLRKTGFEHAEQVGETGFDSSPVTKGVLFRGRKPSPESAEELERSGFDDIHEQRNNEWDL